MTCPNGHESVATDYCDTCGAAMDPSGTLRSLPASAAGGGGAEDGSDGGGSAAAASSAATGPSGPAAADPSAASGGGAADSGDRPCPNCGAPNSPDALFCEVCGYDHTTGTMPRTAAAASPAEPSPPSNASKGLSQPWVAEIWIDPAWYQNQGSPDPLPSQGPPVVIALRNTSLLIGRVSTSRGIHPDIDCGIDNGVSRRHAQLTTDGTRWWVEDLESSNGTYLGDSVGAMPTTALTPHQKREIGADDRLYVGSWTRLVIRESSQDELDALTP